MRSQNLFCNAASSNNRSRIDEVAIAPIARLNAEALPVLWVLGTLGIRILIQVDITYSDRHGSCSVMWVLRKGQRR